ncbi:HlyD family secretion protein [Rikenella microfusus]|uniref:HlyD family secretion protein n=1 Tax=Rikenella microfusus TaxID=28139 RepID=UPI002354B4D5|nr:HlyD family efflux transporter periplasmic adaptor subunit [Rikenella microfusus]
MPQGNHRFYSEEAQDILGKMPSWIIRWGMGIIAFIFLGIGIGACFIHYPQVVSAPITITTLNPPSDLIAKVGGRIDTLFVTDGSYVTEDQAIALLHNTADYSDICTIEAQLKEQPDSFIEADRDYRMGELQSDFSEYRSLCNDYRHYLDANDIPRRQKLLLAQEIKYQEYIAKQRQQRKLLIQDLQLTQKNQERDSALYVQQVISPLDMERTIQNTIQKRNLLATLEASIISTELNVLQVRNQLTELDMQYYNETEQYRRQIQESRSRLASRIKQWKETYLVISPINGRLTLTKYWSSNQNVSLDDKIATVIPLDSTRIIGIMTVPSTGFGKVRVGQQVNVQLNGFPRYEFGVLRGRIIRLSSVPDQEGYIAEVDFPQGMQSSYKEQLDFIQQMDGVGEIITADMRLIEQFIQPVRALFDKAKGN